MSEYDDLLARSRAASEQSARLGADRRVLAAKLEKLESERDRLGAELAETIRAAFRVRGEIAARTQIRDSQGKIREKLKAVKVEITRTHESLARLNKVA